ncbi:MAG TPA: hypothetical protein DHV15_11410 [Treponema sp.]|uniref:Uncharacterized protein n=1 Tax=Treponema denticola (strain ATCC 35405 / DSM 14222 / CIP 103919 / JCM 8153 / KCTC 15104) TaxID=243275 RepID=Q73N30_TREDE|nr:hypothetical protein TDE_1326 [Treponema denticola ATCC 35405]HCY96095.1 hypothetical protein [Treponema sp.]
MLCTKLEDKQRGRIPAELFIISPIKILERNDAL